MCPSPRRSESTGGGIELEQVGQGIERFPLDPESGMKYVSQNLVKYH